MAIARRERLFPSYMIICFFLALASGGDLCAEETELEEVTVQGEGLETSDAPADLTVSSTTIQMSDYRDRTLTLAEVLEQVAGVHVQQLGGLGDFATIAIRGSSGEQVQIYLDGIPLNEASGGAVDLSTIPTELIESITIYRGQAPARFDTSTIGGVVDIKTRPTTDKRHTEISNSYGSLNTYEGAVLHSQSLGKTRFLISYQHSRSDGDFSFLDDNGTPANTSDDRVVKRRNNEFAKNYVLLRVKQPITSKISLEFYNNFFREDRGVPGLGTLKSDNADLSTTRNMTQLRLDWKDLGPGHLRLLVNPFFSYQKSQFSDRLGEIGLAQQDNDDDTFLYGIRISNDFFVGSHQHFTFVATYLGEQFKPENFLAATRTGQASIRNRLSLSAEDEISLLNDRLLLNPMLRIEMIFNDLSGEDPSRSTLASVNSSNDFPVSGKLGARFEIIDSLEATANFGRGYRIPSFLELFGDRGATVGNPNLKPEKSWNYDLGLSWHPDKYRIAASYFEHHTKNLIQFLQSSQFTAQARNLASATIRGVEFEASVGAGPRARPNQGHPRGGAPTINFDVNYTFQWAKDTSGRAGFDGKFLPGRPRHQLHAGVQASYHWARFFADFDFIDENYLDSFNALRVSRRSLVGLGFALSPWKWVQAGFEVKNLLNQRIEDVVGFPVPGRLFFGKLRFII